MSLRWNLILLLHSHPTLLCQLELCGSGGALFVPSEIYDSMRRTLLMAEIGQDNRCGNYSAGQTGRSSSAASGGRGKGPGARRLVQPGQICRQICRRGRESREPGRSFPALLPRVLQTLHEFLKAFCFSSSSSRRTLEILQSPQIPSFKA